MANGIYPVTVPKWGIEMQEVLICIQKCTTSPRYWSDPLELDHYQTEI